VSVSVASCSPLVSGVSDCDRAALQYMSVNPSLDRAVHKVQTRLLFVFTIIVAGCYSIVEATDSLQ
jgi:hypothetical protein